MKKTLLFLHKWLGVALALLFLMWFVSGIVLYYVPFPNLTQAERLTALPPLQLSSGCCLTAQQAATRAGVDFSAVRLGMLADQPVWRLLTKDPKRWQAVDARSGQRLPSLSDDAAIKVAEQFSGRHAISAERIERDQWTVPQGLDPYRPLLKIAMDGEDGLELYVSPTAAEVVRDTRRSERFWNWIGAVPHWIYFTELRRWPQVWHQVVVWLSLPGTLLALTGVALGIWQLFLNKSRWIPYRKFWMRWHHILGLTAGIVTVTWIFSGLLSMNPFSVFTARGATPSERAQWSGITANAIINPATALQLASGIVTKEIDLIQFDGQAWYRLRGAPDQPQVLVRADTDNKEVLSALPDESLRAMLTGLRKQDVSDAPSMSQLDAFDDLYYTQEQNDNTRYTRPLPVLRAQWSDGIVMYVDPASARVLLRADDSTRWQRLLYNGLHSFDFAPLVAHPWLRGTLIVLLSLLGTALCVTSCVVAWRVLVPKKRLR
jgi:hypothetical protein